MINDLIKQLYPIITKSAPIIGSALGINKIGEASMWALYLVGKAFGINMDNVEQLPNAIATDPNSCDKLCQLERSFASLFENKASPSLKSLNLSTIEVNVKFNFDNNQAQYSPT